MCKRGRKKKGWVGRILDGHSVQRKFWQGQWEIIKPKEPAKGVLHLAGLACLSEADVLSHWLRIVGGKCGLSANAVVGSECSSMWVEGAMQREKPDLRDDICKEPTVSSTPDIPVT